MVRKFGAYRIRLNAPLDSFVAYPTNEWLGSVVWYSDVTAVWCFKWDGIEYCDEDGVWHPLPGFIPFATYIQE